MPPTDATDVLNRLLLLEHGRQAVVDQLWATITSYIVETAYSPNAAAISPDVASSNLWMVTAVVATLPANATGLLQLGDITIPLGQGVTILAPVGILLTQTSTRALSSTVAGPISLTLTGQIHPTRGTLA